MDKDGKGRTIQRMGSANSIRDLITTVAAVLGKRSDDMMLTHDGVGLGMANARLA